MVLLHNDLVCDPFAGQQAGISTGKNCAKGGIQLGELMGKEVGYDDIGSEDVSSLKLLRGEDHIVKLLLQGARSL